VPRPRPPRSDGAWWIARIGRKKRFSPSRSRGVGSPPPVGHCTGGRRLVRCLPASQRKFAGVLGGPPVNGEFPMYGRAPRKGERCGGVFRSRQVEAWRSAGGLVATVIAAGDRGRETPSSGKATASDDPNRAVMGPTARGHSERSTHMTQAGCNAACRSSRVPKAQGIPNDSSARHHGWRDRRVHPEIVAVACGSDNA